MPVFSKMVYDWTEYILWWWWGNIWEPLNLTVTSAWLDATITWEDNEIWTIPPTTFRKSELVRKIGSAPTSPSDWTLVVTETVKDTYKVSGYVDQWLTDGETYYYRVFSYSDLWGISYCDAVSVTPSGWWQPWANTLVYLTLDWDTLDTSGNGRDGTLNFSWYTYEYLSGNAWTKYIKMVWANSMSDCISGTYSDTALWSWDRTVSCWIKFFTIGGVDVQSPVSPFYLWNRNWGSDWGWFGMFNFQNVHNPADYIWILRYFSDPENSSYSSYDYNWHNYIITYNDTNKAKIYVDGQQVIMTANANSSFNTTDTAYQLWPIRTGVSWMTIWCSSFIIEDKERTAQEISDYFDSNKWDYWIS